MTKAPKDWRAVGEALFEFEGDHIKSRDNDVFYGPPELDLADALVWSARGDSQRLIAYLRSNKPFTLSETDRGFVVRRLTRQEWKPKRGRRKDTEARYGARVAREFYAKWK